MVCVADGTLAANRLRKQFDQAELRIDAVDQNNQHVADWFLTERGVRDDVTITYVTPLYGAFTKPTASATLGSLLAEKNIEVVTEFNTGEVDNEAKKLISYDGTEVPFDLAVVIPAHDGAGYVLDSPELGDALGFVRTDKATLQSHVRPNIFVLGDAASVDLFGIERSDLIDELGDIITVGEFYDMAAGGHIIFT